MDYTEILALYGWDEQAASESVKDVPPMELIVEALVDSGFD